MDIKGKIAVVTGASGGIGLACARALSKAGAKVVISARSLEKLKALEKEIPGSFAVKADMRRPEDIKRLVSESVKKFGRIDLLVNNAGQGMSGTVEKMDVGQYKEIMELNVYGLLRAMQEAIPVMRKQGGGMIVNVSSQVTKMYIPGLSGYSSTKYAVNALSLIARQELERDKIVVSLLHPMLTDTDFFRNSLGKSDWYSGRPLPNAHPPEKVAGKLLELVKSEEPEALVE